MKRYLEVANEKWSLTVEVDTCDRCSTWRWWDQALWQNPATGKVHVRSSGKTACGLELPRATPEKRLLTVVKAVA